MGRQVIWGIIRGPLKSKVNAQSQTKKLRLKLKDKAKPKKTKPKKPTKNEKKINLKGVIHTLSNSRNRAADYAL